MFYIICIIDAIVFGFILGSKEDSFLIGLLVAGLTVFLAGFLFKPYQVISVGAWGYLLYTWISPNQPELKVVVILAAVVLGRLLIAWLHSIFDEDWNSTPTTLPSTIPVEENDLSYSYPNGSPITHNEPEKKRTKINYKSDNVVDLSKRFNRNSD